MAKNKIWEFELDGKKHKVVYEVKIGLSGPQGKMTVDGKEDIIKSGGLASLSPSDYHFEIGGHKCFITMSSGVKKANLVIDGKSLDNGKEVKPSLPIQKWAWGFATACMAVPIVSLGGAIPAGIGFGGAAGCLQISKKPDWSRNKKVMACAAVTAFAWLLFILLIALVYMVSAGRA